MRARFVLSEMAIGLRRNLTMTVAVVVTVAISLALFGAGLLIRTQVETMKDYWYDRVEVSIFLCGRGSTSPSCAAGPVTPEQREEIKNELYAMPAVKTVFYESQDDAFRRFKQQFKDSPDLVKNVSAEALPESYRVKLADPTAFEEVAGAFRGRPGVEDVIDQRQLLDRFFRVLNRLQMAALITAIIQVVAAVLLIGNTIRVAAFSRRRETGIMRLVGASNLYIQLPFLLEGALAGLVGALFAVGLLVLFKHFLVDGVLKPAFRFTAFVGWDAVWAIVPILLVTGVVLSALASFITLRRHLRV
ncbi:MAG TPA: permease-like cell division protein FtsX [Mycobacteriales bacterium]|nr:permease-like cell division protein FtsX [Mycobacteriales bacterium]